MKIVIKIEATQTRLFLVGVIFAVAFGAAALLDHLLRDQVSTDTQPNGEPTEIWPRWHSQFSEPMVYRQSERVPYSYVVLPRMQLMLPPSLRKPPRSVGYVGGLHLNRNTSCHGASSQQAPLKVTVRALDL
jgi:hypothetical protein